MEPICCPATSVNNYQTSQRTHPRRTKISSIIAYRTAKQISVSLCCYHCTPCFLSCLQGSNRHIFIWWK